MASSREYLESIVALAVIVLTDHIRDYLAEHDPMALEQIQEALKL
jgi:hypothetical protein